MEFMLQNTRTAKREKSSTPSDANIHLNNNKSSHFFPQFNRLLARIRCLDDALARLSEGSSNLPDSLCFIPKESRYIFNREKETPTESLVTLKSSKWIEDFSLVINTKVPEKQFLFDKEQQEFLKSKKTDSRKIIVFVSKAAEIVNDKGVWAKVDRVDLVDIFSNKSEIFVEFDAPTFLQIVKFEHESGVTTSPPTLLPFPSIRENLVFGQIQSISNWTEVVEATYGVSLLTKTNLAAVVAADSKKVQWMAEKPTSSWSSKHEMELIRFLTEIPGSDLTKRQFGKVTAFVDNIELSSTLETKKISIQNLTDDNTTTFWESDSQDGFHFIRLLMKKHVIVDEIFITVDSSDDSYFPERVEVYGGDSKSDLSILSHTDIFVSGVEEVSVLSGNSKKLKILEIRIAECRDEGIDCRVRGLRIKPKYEQYHQTDDLDPKIFERVSLENGDLREEYRSIAGIDKDRLYWRSIVLRRLSTLIDSVLPFVVPECRFSGQIHLRWLEQARMLFPLCSRRLKLIEQFLKKTEIEDYKIAPKLFINRRLAAENKSDPNSTVFRQIYKGIEISEEDDGKMEYRWSTRQDQWWECKFIGEGVIDQGGGFRDSLCDMAEELCPSETDKSSALSFFIRCPDRFCDSKSQDTFILHPGCNDLKELEWLGKIMGACLRTKELLDLPLSKYTWKQILGQPVSWSEDYSSVDRDEVKFLTDLEKCDSESNFESMMKGHRRTFQCSLSNGELVNLKSEAFTMKELGFDNRAEFVKLTKEMLMKESELQLKALRKGLLQVVPEAALQLLTWKELELRICGNPKISVTDLKNSAHYEDVDASEKRVEYLWLALKNFTNDERSRFLRFVSGRKRLPTPIYLCGEKSDKSTDSLPESSTCSNTLFLPEYSSAEVCEEKLRYAVRHCHAIDTDVSPWDQ